MAAVDDVTTYCFASVNDDASGSLDKANGGLCPGQVTVVPFQSPAIVGDAVQVSWTVAITTSSVTFKTINPLTTDILHSTLYLCPGNDRRVACGNRIDLLASTGGIRGTKFAPATGTAQFSSTVKLLAGPGPFTLVVKATVVSNYTKENVTQPAFIDMVTYRNVQLVEPDPTTDATPIALGIAGGVIGLVLLIVLGCCWHRRRQRERTERQIATYAGAYIVRSRVNSYDRDPSRTTHRELSHYSSHVTQPSTFHGPDQNLHYQPHHHTTADPNVNYDLKLTQYSSASVSPMSDSPSTTSPTPTAEATPSYLNFAMSPLVEDELDISRSVSFSSLDPPQSFDEGNGYLNYALSPLVEHSHSRGFDALRGGMEMVHEEDSDDGMLPLPRDPRTSG
ncbi:hypothetical protein H310_08051 [Aphanomyces invadans]|uniref:Uncharacterized protein n=1 Tax=Aphanomyces invadans TaxID=157072 RepID=A0A024U133_9STRA|nr:hypothetical protein H310_08051 [Aphanomyces invadans]ETV99322.1 hypothetical protein H310_08051 [Aphanomyces invadans]|eukprot:XP_008871878.1 hypothetical protein H310_08051 [Aphanomyces invadans]